MLKLNDPMDSMGARPQTVVWDPKDFDQFMEAHDRIRKLEGSGFVRHKYSEDGECVLFPPSMDEHLGLMRVLSQNGDDRIIWDRRSPNQVREAFGKFKELIDKGYTAYVTLVDGSRGHKITEFDPGLEEVIMTAREVTMVPRTVPG